jgi:Amidohydrolase family
LAKTGLSPLKILQMTTLNPAEFLARTGTMDSIEVGKNEKQYTRYISECLEIWDQLTGSDSFILHPLKKSPPLIANRSIQLCPIQAIPTEFAPCVLPVLGHRTSQSAALPNSVWDYRPLSYDPRLDAV